MGNGWHTDRGSNSKCRWVESRLIIRPVDLDNFSTMKIVRLLILVAFGLMAPAGAFSEETIKKEIDVGYAPMGLIKPVLKQALSPNGRFVMLPGKGSVMVIDIPDGIIAAETALAQAEFPKVDVALDFEFVTGLPPRYSKIVVGQEVPFPVAYNAPTIFVGPNGAITVIPSTPTRFETRNIGVTSETVSSINPDGSINLDINTETTEFERFINYGSAILPAGTVGTVPIGGPVSDPGFFGPFINSGDILVPIISTTRISTSVVIKPSVRLGAVHLNLMPRFTIENPDPGGQSPRKPVEIDMRDFRTIVEVPNGEVGRVYGFTGASDEFNRHFLGAENPDGPGLAAIVVKASIKPPGTAASLDDSPETIVTSKNESEAARPVPEEAQTLEETFEPQN